MGNKVEIKKIINSDTINKSRFISSLSHDMRSPFNSIIGFGKLLLKDDSVDPDTKEKISIIFQNSEKLLKMVDSLMEFHKLDCDKTTVEKITFELKAISETLSDKYKKENLAANNVFIEHLECNNHATINSDFEKIIFILNTLIEVSSHYSHIQKMNISIVLENDNIDSNYFLNFIINDSNNVEVWNRISDLISNYFTHAENIPKSITMFEKLSVLIAMKYLKIMDGYLEYEPLPDERTQLTISIPVEATNIQSNEIIHHTKENTNTEKQNAIKILVVDDQSENSFLMKELLEDKGYSVHTADNGLTAIEETEKWNPDLIFMDWRMPKMNGLDATKHIRSIKKFDHIKIIALTANIFAEFKDEIIAAGANDFIKKPFMEEQIDELLEKHLNNEKENTIVKEGSEYDFTSLSEGLKSQIIEAASMGISSDLKNIIASSPEISEKVSILLLKLVDEYRFDLIIKYLE